MEKKQQKICYFCGQACSPGEGGAVYLSGTGKHIAWACPKDYLAFNGEKITPPKQMVISWLEQSDDYVVLAVQPDNKGVAVGLHIKEPGSTKHLSFLRALNVASTQLWKSLSDEPKVSR